MRMSDRTEATPGEADAAGRAAYRAGLPCDAPDYGREDRRARWRCGWKREQAAAGERTVIRALAEKMAQELDVHVDRAEVAARNLIARGLIELVEVPR